VGLSLVLPPARGFAHIGVIKMLEAQGIVADIVVGTSAGSVAGVLYAAGHSGFDLQRLAFDLDSAMVTDWRLFGTGLIKGEALQNYVNRLVNNQPIENLPRRFACVTTRLRDGVGVLLQRGNAGQAVRASSAVPGIFEPVMMNTDEYVDGGLVSPVPVGYAKQMGADFIIAVDVSTPPASGLATGKVDLLMRAYDIMGRGLRMAQLPAADVVITPNLNGIASTDFEGKNRAILAGEQAVMAALPQIREKLAARGGVAPAAAKTNGG
jgi:NTE family protein